MNPAHLIIVSLITLIYWTMGFWTGQDKNNDFWPNGPSLLLAGCAIISFCLGLFVLVMEAL